jgi:plasmid rolling circle replication initiator protein Rep
MNFKKKLIAIFRIFILLMICFLILTGKVYSTDEILETQKDSLSISSFIKEANSYTKKAFPELNVGDLLNSAIKGDVDNGMIYKAIISLIGKEVLEAIRVLRSNFSNHYYT